MPETTSHTSTHKFRAAILAELDGTHDRNRRLQDFAPQLIVTQKPTHRRLWLKTALAVLSFFLFCYSASGLYTIQVKHRPAQNNTHQVKALNQIATPGLPVRLKIPSIGVDAVIEHVAVTSLGEMAVPSGVIDTGWFSLGARPGEKGSAVIAGHFNGKNGEAGVFNNLSKLKAGDTVSVEDEDGTSFEFIVRESQAYDPGYAETVFGSNDGVHLNLITCDGTWDADKKSYSKRLIVFADMSAGD